jgi:hypothetical protein
MYQKLFSALNQFVILSPQHQEELTKMFGLRPVALPLDRGDKAKQNPAHVWAREQDFSRKTACDVHDLPENLYKR